MFSRGTIKLNFTEEGRQTTWCSLSQSHRPGCEVLNMTLLPRRHLSTAGFVTSLQTWMMLSRLVYDGIKYLSYLKYICCQVGSSWKRRGQAAESICQRENALYWLASVLNVVCLDLISTWSDCFHFGTLTESKVPPQFTKKLPETCICSVGKTMKIESRLCGSEPLNITWCKDNKEIGASDKYEISFQNNMATLCVRDSGTSDSGVYTCEASNEVGKASCQASVTISGRVESGVSQSATAVSC